MWWSHTDFCRVIYMYICTSILLMYFPVTNLTVLKWLWGFCFCFFYVNVLMIKWLRPQWSSNSTDNKTTQHWATDVTTSELQRGQLDQTCGSQSYYCTYVFVSWTSSWSWSAKTPFDQGHKLFQFVFRFFFSSIHLSLLNNKVTHPVLLVNQ